MTGPVAAATTDQQADFWLMHRRAAHPAAYNVAGVLPVAGPLDRDRLAAALAAVVAATPLLRTSFHDDAGELRALTWPAAAPEVLVADGGADLAAYALRPFDLAVPGAVRFVLRPAGERRHELLVVSHHILLDGTGLRDLAEDCLTVAGGAPPPVRPAYAEYAGRRVRARLADGPRDRAFWRDRLAGCPVPPPVVATDRLEQAELALTGAETAAVRAECGRSGVTPFVLLAAALATLGADRGTVVGVPRDGRDEELPALGTYAGMLPLRVDPAGTPAAVREGVLDLLVHSAVSLREVLDAAESACVPWRYVLNGYDAGAERACGALTVGPLRPVSTGAKAEFAVTLVETGGELRLVAVRPVAGAPGRAAELLADLVGAVRRLAGLDDGLRLETARDLWDEVWASPDASVRPDAPRFRAEEVEAYRRTVLRLAHDGGPPRRVLEVGCGAGQVAALLAPAAERYVGTDPSPAGLAATAAEVPGAELVEAFAHEVPARVSGRFDLVVLAGVVQFFPDRDYLRRALAGLLGLVAPGGRLLVADVVPPGTGQFEGCLHLTPADFGGVPAQVEVRPRTGPGLPAVLAARYDVVLRPLAEPAPAAPAPVGPRPPAPAPAPADLEHVITDALAEVLGRPVRARDDLFELGGTSISAAAVVTAVRRRAGVKLRVRDFFSGPATPVRIAALAQERSSR